MSLAPSKPLFKAIETQCLAPDYLRQLCDYSRPFGVDTVIAMTGEWDGWTMFDYREFGFARPAAELEFAARKRAATAEAIKVIQAAGMACYLWRHELSMHPAHIAQLNPAVRQLCYGQGGAASQAATLDLGFFDPSKDALWDYISWRFKHLFELFPTLDGVVLTCLTETKLPLLNLAGKLSPTEVLTRLLQVAIRACQVHGKRLIVRNWGAYRDPHKPMGHLLYDALAAAQAPPEVWVLDKAYEPDFTLGYPVNQGLATQARRHPTLLELELSGEQEGLDTLPLASPEESQSAIQQGLKHGCQGFVIRVDSAPDTIQWWFTHHTLGTVNEINLYASLRLLQAPGLDLAVVWEEWATSRFGPALAPQMVRLLRPTLDWGSKLYLLQGNRFYNYCGHVSPAIGNILHHLRYFYTAMPADQRWANALRHPTDHDLALLLAEKDEAVAGYRQGRRALQRLKGRLPAADYELYRRGFDQAVAVARLYRVFTEMTLLVLQAKAEGLTPSTELRLARLAREFRRQLRTSHFPNRDLGLHLAGPQDFVAQCRQGLAAFDPLLAGLPRVVPGTPKGVT